jgi:predicted transcriptional regulator of viral defense system
MKKNSYNIWKETIKFFNTKVNQEVTRKELRANVKRFGNYSLDSRDIYRSILEKAGYLKHIGLGRYQVIKEIPDVSLTLMTDFASSAPMAWLKYWGGLEYYLQSEYYLKSRRKNGKGHNKNI